MQEYSRAETDPCLLPVGQPPLSNMRRNVSFAKVHVREYKIGLGDQPCSSGPPVGLGWEFRETLDTDVEEYEAARKSTRRCSHEMKMPAAVRVAKLLEHGHSKEDIRKTAVQSRRAMTGRIASANQTEACFVAAQALESLGRKMKRVVVGKKELSRKDLLNAGGDVQLLRSSPQMRRAYSMGEFLTQSEDGRSRLRGILKTSKSASVKDPISEALTEEESDSDGSHKSGEVRRVASLDERQLVLSGDQPTKEVNVPVDGQGEEEDGLFF